MIRRPPRSTLFPTRRSSDLGLHGCLRRCIGGADDHPNDVVLVTEGDAVPRLLLCPADRKSTRLNSSHLVISYAVFCLKKKKKRHIYTIYSVVTTAST